METRVSKVNISAAGGTAAKGSQTCKITLPNSWIEQLGVTPKDREVVLTFDGESIILKKHLTGKTFADTKTAIGHEVKKISFFDEQTLCSVIYADFTDQSLTVENFCKDPVKTAFGNCSQPDWKDFQWFLEERCISNHRDGLQHYLRELQLDEYDPVAIIQKTKGRMSEDQQWIQIEEVAL